MLEEAADRFEARAERIERPALRAQLVSSLAFATLAFAVTAVVSDYQAGLVAAGIAVFATLVVVGGSFNSFRDSLYEAGRSARARQLPHKRRLLEATVGGELLEELRKLPFRRADGVHEVYVRQRSDGTVEFHELANC